jgi:predicted nucleic acid-binding protein
MFLVDTVTLSELRRRQRDPMVVAWFNRQRTTDLFLSVITIGDIECRIARQRAIDPAFATSAELMIAATALEHGFTVGTRNVSDFEATGVAVLDPFGRWP